MMAEFTSLEITLSRDVDENGGDFRTLTVDDSYDDSLSEHLADLYDEGYEVVSAVVYGFEFVEDIWESIDEKNVSHLCDAFDVFCMEKNNVDIVVAFLKVMPSAEVLSWDDCIYIRGADHEDVVREWNDLFNKSYKQIAGDNHWDLKFAEAEIFPDWMPTNKTFWREALDNIASQESSVVVEFNDEIYFFG